MLLRPELLPLKVHRLCSKPCTAVCIRQTTEQFSKSSNLVVLSYVQVARMITHMRCHSLYQNQSNTAWQTLLQASGTTLELHGSLEPSFHDGVSMPSTCSLDSLHCGVQEGRFRALTIPALAAIVLLLAAYFFEVVRAMWRIGRQLYMPLHHVAVLLTVEVRNLAL